MLAVARDRRGDLVNGRERRINSHRRQAYLTELTIYDERVYTEPWVTPMATIKLVPDTELWEYFCVPSESDAFNQRFGNN